MFRGVCARSHGNVSLIPRAKESLLTFIYLSFSFQWGLVDVNRGVTDERVPSGEGGLRAWQ